MSQALRGSAAVVGVGLAGLGEAPGGRTAIDIMAEAAHAALADAGLSVRDVDGLFPCSSFHMLPGVAVAEYLGIRPTFSDANMIGGASPVHHLLNAALALQAGLCKVALICYGSNQRTAFGRLAANSLSDPRPYEIPYHPRYPISAYALAAARHMHEFGTTREQLAEVAVAARKWAAMNPRAFMREPLSIQDVLSSRIVAYPLTVRDCCLVTDGGGAAVMVRADRARDCRRQPVYLLGAATAHWHWQISTMWDLTTTAAADSGRGAFKMAGLSPADIDVLQLYDAFTINPILFLEDLGFCRKGEGGAFVANGRIAPGGSLPVNTNGGGLSFGHPGAYGVFTIVEAVEQLRGQSGERQVKGAKTALCHGNGAVLSAQSTAILGTAAAL